MEKMEIGIEGFSYPMPCAIVGVTVDGKANYLTVAWFTMVNLKPPLLGIALSSTHHTNAGIRAKGTFSVNIPSKDMVAITDFCGIVSGRMYDKAQAFTTFFGKLESAPMIEECPYNLECRLVQIVELPSNQFFIGEVVAAYSDERYLTEGIPDMKKIGPFVLSMPDKRYLAIGEDLGQAWNIGKKFIAERNVREGK